MGEKIRKEEREEKSGVLSGCGDLLRVACGLGVAINDLTLLLHLEGRGTGDFLEEVCVDISPGVNMRDRIGGAGTHWERMRD